MVALQKELASVNERKKKLDARKKKLDVRKKKLDVKKERLEELIVEFTGHEEEEEERIWMRMSSSMLRWGTWIHTNIRVW